MTLLDTAYAWHERFQRGHTAPDPSGCWAWRGALDNGYGRFWLHGKSRLAHRIAFELANGPIPPGLQVDHLCRNRSCVNPAHLEAVTLAANVLRGEGRSAHNARKVACAHGHPFDEANTYHRRNGARACKTCAVDRTKAWREARA